MRRETALAARHETHYACAAAIFTKYEGVADDDQLLAALEKKYDALNDQLLLDLLRYTNIKYPKPVCNLRKRIAWKTMFNQSSF